MNREEIVTDLLETYFWAGDMWANEDGTIFIPWDDGNTEGPILLCVGEWIENCVDEDYILDLSDEDYGWVEEQVTTHFTEKYRNYLIEQLRLLAKENI